MSANEILLGFSFLYSTLNGDLSLSGYAPGGIYRSLAPPNTTTPFVVYSFQSGSDSVTMNGFRMVVECSFLVKAVGPAKSMAAIANASARIDVLLGGPPGTPVSGNPTGGKVLSCYRQAPFHLDELINADLWSNSGGSYRLIIEQS